MTPSATSLSLVVYLALFSAAIGNLLWNFGVSIVGVPVASLYINMSAVFTVLMVMALGIYPTMEQILGGLHVASRKIYLNTKHIKLFEANPGLERSTTGHEAGHRVWRHGDVAEGFQLGSK